MKSPDSTVTPEKMLDPLMSHTFLQLPSASSEALFNQLIVVRGFLAKEVAEWFEHTRLRCLPLVNRKDQIIVAGVGPYFEAVSAIGVLAVCLNLATKYRVSEAAPLNEAVEWLRVLVAL